MASTAVLERAPRIDTEETVSTQAAEAHNARMSEAYRLLMSDVAVNQGSESRTPVAEYNAPVLERPVAPAAEMPPRAELTYTPTIAPTEKPQLFDNLEYRDGRVVRTDIVNAAVVAPIAPAIEREEDEDARPTRRTLDTLSRRTLEAAPATVAVMETTAERTSFFASLSKGMKIAMAVVAVVIVLAIAMIVINTGIINGLNAGISAKQAFLNELSMTSQVIRERISEVTDPAYIDQYAKYVLGLIR